MRKLWFASLGVAAVIVIVVASLVFVADQAPTTAAGAALKTSWGEPDLMGSWDVVATQIPLQRPAKYAGKEFFTDAERAELDGIRAAMPGNETRSVRGTVVDVAGAYNSVYTRRSPTGRRTSLIVDPPDGRIPPLTPEVQKRNQAFRELYAALVQSTDTCKNKWPGCEGGKYDPKPSPRRFEPLPSYPAGNLIGGGGHLNRSDGPEDRGPSERCMTAILPDFTGYREIVQSPGAVSILHDTGQGQGWNRVVNITSAPHLPADVRQPWGDSRGRWEGNTLVVDVTNFTPRWEFQGSRENLHLVERWTRTDANTIEYVVTMDDPTTWTKPWTVKQEYKKLDDQFNQVWREPRCHEGNFGMIGLLGGARKIEQAFAEGKGPDPATINTVQPTGSANIIGVEAGDEDGDPLQ